MRNIRAIVFIDESVGTSRLQSAVEAVLSGLDSTFESVVCRLGRSVIPREVIEHRKDGPIFIFLSQHTELDWLKDELLHEGLSNKICILCSFIEEEERYEKSSGSIHRDGYRLVIMQEGRDMQVFITQLLSELRSVERELLLHPERYVPTGQLTVESLEPYDVLSARKQVRVDPTGHGYIEFEWEIFVTGEGFEGTTHYFGLDSSVPRDQTIPPIEEMLALPLRARHDKATFDCALLWSTDRDLTMSPIELTDQSTERYRVVRFLFLPPPSPGSIIRFAWSWAHPAVFVKHGTDASSFRCIRDFAKLDLVCRFEHADAATPICFSHDGEPALQIVNPAGVDQAHIHGVGRRSLNFTQYSWRFEGAQLNSKYIVRWQLPSNNQPS